MAAVAFEGRTGESLAAEGVCRLVDAVLAVVFETADVGEFIVLGVVKRVVDFGLGIVLAASSVTAARLMFILLFHVSLQILSGFDFFETVDGRYVFHGDVQTETTSLIDLDILHNILSLIHVNDLLSVLLVFSSLLNVLYLLALLFLLLVFPLPLLLLGVIHQVQNPFGHLRVHLFLVHSHAFDHFALLLQVPFLYVLQSHSQTMRCLLPCISVRHELFQFPDAAEAVFGREVVPHNRFLQFAGHPFSKCVETPAVEPQ